VHQTATYEEFGTLLVEIEACLNSRPLCALPNDPHTSYLSPGHFLIGEPLTQLPTIDYSNIKMSRLSRWQTYQQQLQNYWKDGLQTTFTSCNTANAGTAHPPTYNLEIPWSWGKTTRLHFTGLQWSSLVSIQAQTAEYEWSQSRHPKGNSNAQLQKFAPFRMLRMSYSFITIWGVPACSCRGQICWISFFAELIFFFDLFLFDFIWLLEFACIYFNVNLRLLLCSVASESLVAHASLFGN